MSAIAHSVDDSAGSASGIDSLAEQAAQLDMFVRQTAADGVSLDAVESHAFDQTLRIGQVAIDLFLSMRERGDRGP